MKLLTNSICAPQGFLAASTHAGIKRRSHKDDMALIYSQTPAVAAGVFTCNQAKAAPVLWSQQCLLQPLQAIVINSGNANACTGQQGMTDTRQMATLTATALGMTPETVAVASTGVIGVPLPMAKISAGIASLTTKINTLTSLRTGSWHPCQDDAAAESAAKAILTTDTFTKTIAVEFALGGKRGRIGGIAKGSGMIHPMMATMLAFITTDVAINQSALQTALSQINADSFNMITVDGDSSTNDMVLMLANGACGNLEITSTDSTEWQAFYQALNFVCIHLAKEIAKDGEGATKLIEVQVKGAVNTEEARLAARAVCRSPLVKTAVFGEDANWGRIASAVGSSGAQLDLNRMSIALNHPPLEKEGKGDLSYLPLFHEGKPLPFDEDLARNLLKEKTVIFHIDLGIGAGESTAWGCDLTPGYIHINASYRS